MNLLKRLSFGDEDRGQIVLSDPTRVRVDGRSRSAKLKIGGAGYPTDADLWVRSAPMRPQAVQRWTGFQVDARMPVGTGLGFRLHDGSATWSWSGGEWRTPATVWNSEAEVTAHLSAWDATARHLALVCNLTTTDPRVTPELLGLRLICELDLPGILEDVIYRTLVRALGAVRSTAEFAAAADGTDTVAFGAVFDAARVRFQTTGLEAVHDIDADPGKTTNLLAGWDAEAREIALSAAPAEGAKLAIRVQYAPSVVFHATDPDWIEVEPAASVLITGLRPARSWRGPGGDHVTSRFATSPEIRYIPAGRVTDYRADLRVVAPNGVSLIRLQEEVGRFVRAHPMLTTTGSDEIVGLDLGPFSSLGGGSASGARMAQAVLRILGVHEPEEMKTAEHGVYPVQRVQFTGDGLG